MLKQALRRVEGCHCYEGCVECVASENCKHANEVMSKAGSEVILKSLLGMEIDVDALPMGPVDERDRGIETVVLAETVMGKGRLRGLGDLADDGEVNIKNEPED